MVGLVVGPKGTTIKRIQQTTHTYIVTPSREKDPVFEVTGKFFYCTVHFVGSDKCKAKKNTVGVFFPALYDHLYSYR